METQTFVGAATLALMLALTRAFSLNTVFFRNLIQPSNYEINHLVKLDGSALMQGYDVYLYMENGQD